MIFRRYCFLLTLLVVLFFVYRILLNCGTNVSGSAASTQIVGCKYFSPVVQVHGVKENETTLAVVIDVFRKMGYHVQFNDLLDWDVLWSYTYPFYSLEEKMMNLKSKMVNHFPGTGFITQKSYLASLNINRIPKAFLFPSMKEEFIEYAKSNKNKLWILKSQKHRGMKLLNGFKNLNTRGSFVQEFINNPLLINQRRFDMGIYVMLTSIDPLRVYMYSGDVLLRFCSEDYTNPPNPDVPESFVVGDAYEPIWEIPDLKHYYSEMNYTAKESLNAYLQSRGKEPDKLWSQILETIRNVYIKSEDNFKKSSMLLGSLRNFFELVRFDFIPDENLNVYLLEVNMSPNLSPAHFAENKLLYEQVVFNSLSLVGLVRKFPNSFVYSVGYQSVAT